MALLGYLVDGINRFIKGITGLIIGVARLMNGWGVRPGPQEPGAAAPPPPHPPHPPPPPAAAPGPQPGPPAIN